MRGDRGGNRLNEAFQYVDDRFLDVAEQQKERQKGVKRKRIIRSFSIAAACLCLFIVLPVGVMAKNWFGLRDLLIPGWGNENGRITLFGYQESPEVQAYAEWNDFLANYDTDHKIAEELGNKIFVAEGREDWLLYHVYSYEMGEKLDEIAERYDLKLHTKMEDVSLEKFISNVGNIFLDEPCTGGAYIYEDGTFAFDGDVELIDGKDVAVQFRRAVKGTFHDVFLSIGTLEEYTEWQYISDCGEPVLLALAPHKALVIADFEQCFVTVNVLSGRDDGLTEATVQELADQFDFRILKDVRKPVWDEYHTGYTEQEEKTIILKENIRDRNMREAENIYFVEQAMTMDQVGCEEETQAVLAAMSKLTDADFESAILWEENSQRDIPGAHVVLLNDKGTSRVRVYGYESEEYHTRGLIVECDGQRNYFDYCWNKNIGSVELCQGDYDCDGMDELCLCMSGADGTGVSVERLIIFEISPEDKGLSSCEFSGEIQQIKSKLFFGIDADTGSLVIQNESEEVIFELMPDEVTGDLLLGIDCFNQVKFDVEDGRIWMTVDIGIWHEGQGIGFFLSDGRGTMHFEVTYSEGEFFLK